ncbi:hypothetical protein [Pedobacter gandavensis]|uniref:hypothetical protein n=1 Tax=Pedobacter gandavensis TaxID=2679963 RepID=UPI002930002F|nr:hypothetical protein [Pedobacter gandavensis]
MAYEKIVLSTSELENTQAFPAFLLSAIPAAIGVGTSFAKTALDKKALSYASSYSGTLTSKELCFFDGAFNPFSLNITRNTFEKKDSLPKESAIIVLETVADGALYRFKLKQLVLNASKARVRKESEKTGKTIDLNIEIQVSVVYRDSWKLDSISPKEKIPRYSLKSTILGTSAITVTGIEPGSPYILESDNDNALYSDWFQKIPQPSLNSELTTILENKHEKNECWTTIKVTVKEANPYGVKATTIAEFFSGSQESLTDLLKSFVPPQKE